LRNNPHTPADPRAVATYLITFSCYGQHLHGNEQGSVDREHNQRDTRLLPLDEPRYETEKALMREAPYRLELREQRVVLEAIQKVCSHRRWTLDACHVRTTHVHVVVTTDADGAKVMNDCKAYSNRALNSAGERRTKRWARHGSVRSVSTAEQLVNAIRYVIDGQGEPMAVWPDKRQFEPRA